MKLLSAVSFVLLSLDARAASSSSIRGREPGANLAASESNALDSNCPIFVDNPNGNSDLTQQMIDATKPCGFYEAAGCDYEVIPANVDHPGEGPGDLAFIPYIVQFDIGIHPRLKVKVMQDHTAWGEGQPCIGCEAEGEGETCLELIVEGNSAATGGCAGKCGPGCDVVGGAGWAKDCLKHDVCASYKQLVSRGKYFDDDDGFCYDPDCGDEAAQTVHNCFVHHRFWRDTDIVCDQSYFDSEPRAYGHWSFATNLFGGPCDNFIDWNNGQGIPDEDRIDNNYVFESQGVDLSVKVSRE